MGAAGALITLTGMLNAVVGCTVSHILDGLGAFNEVQLSGGSSFVRPTTLHFTQAGAPHRVQAT